MSTILVTGGGAGLGKAIVAALRADGHSVIVFDRKFGNDVRNPPPALPAALDVLINCAGVNITAWLRDMTHDIWSEVIGVNAYGIMRMSQWALPRLIESKGTIINIVSNASHMPMTTSIAYNASKGAAHIMTLQMARELGREHGITVFGISPNKLAGTEMSKDIEEQVVQQRGWSAEYARQYQLAALPAGEETDPEVLADFIRYLLQSKRHHKFLTGTVIPYGA